jgi:cellulose biosynthesis protein BcsQ
MDYVFTPVTQERMVMRSSMAFVLAIREYMHRHKDVPLRGIYMFWNRMDKRVSKDLYNSYTEIFRSLKLPAMETVIPSAERYNKDFGMKGFFFRSTLFPPPPSALRGSNLDLLATEIETILKLQ